MHAIIRQGNGNYYISAVFAHYRDTASQYPDKTDWWVVWDAEKKKLIRQMNAVSLPTGIHLQVLIIDDDRHDWNMDERGIGCVDFLNKELLDSLLGSSQQPEELLEQCRRMDDGFAYREYPEIKTPQDIENLTWATGGFHDGHLDTVKPGDDSVYLLFDGTWECKVEVWLWGELEYDISAKTSAEFDPYWYGSTVLLQDGFVYFSDDCGMTVEEITASHCYFKARHMKYHIIPN